MSDQDNVFLNSEGDQWFQRNISALHSKEKIEKDIPIKVIKMYPELKPKKVLELGCSNGYRLSEINKIFNSECVGVEPSQAAIDDGKKLYPNIQLHQGVLADIPIKNSLFDLVIVCFVFHWVGRSTLLQSVAEVDRTVAEDGYLLLGDFLPDAPTRRRYHHRNDHEMYTYKQDYAKMFLESGLYQVVSRVTFDQDTGTMMHNTESGRRGVHTLMRKVKNGTYIEG